MTDEAQKLRRFKDAVYTEAEGKVNKLISEARSEKDAKLKEARESVSSRISEEKLRIDKEQRQRLTREVSAARLEAQRRILLHREELSGRVFENVKKRLEDFRNSGGYSVWLERAVMTAREQYPEQTGVIILSPADEKYAAKLKSVSGFEAEADPSILLGGVSVRFDNINVVIDCTFDSALEEESESFCRTAGLAVGQE
ncbi:V-type ATP synthase subunit E [Ruminococcus sp. Marseille-P6503]|uniref:V-type ATP synthase subunit E n=1 Tax=Ruminococcus sp. Marseille-P6503 TaxID=2364796 RepID=UPI000F534841|nr:V-type ATP synthase subunit E [Ruminococcus sp. Marseille-P6503]